NGRHGCRPLLGASFHFMPLEFNMIIPSPAGADSPLQQQDPWNDPLDVFLSADEHFEAQSTSEPAASTATSAPGSSGLDQVIEDGISAIEADWPPTTL